MMDAPYTKTPNAIYAALGEMSEAEMRVTLALVRETYGYHRDSCKMTYAAFAAYGLSSPDSIRRGIEAALGRGFFVRGDGRSEFTIDCANTTVNVENDDLNTTATVVFDDANTTVNVENDGLNTTATVVLDTPKHYGKRSVSLLKKEREEERKKERARASSAPPNGFWDIPPTLAVHEPFVRAWHDWLVYVDERRIDFVETQARAVLQTLDGWGPTRATAAVLESIKRGWRSVYEPKPEPVVVGRSGQLDATALRAALWQGVE